MEPPLTQVGRAIINEGGAPTGVACIGDTGAGTGDIKLVAGCGPGTDRFQGRKLYSQVHTEVVSSLAKGKRQIKGDRTHWGTGLINHRIGAEVNYYNALHGLRE